MSRLLTVLTVFPSLLLLSGCGPGRPETLPVSGTLTIDGKPVPHATLQFIPDEGRAASGNTDENGRFTLTTYELNDGALMATHRVAVFAVEQLSPTEQMIHVPEIYGDPISSGLKSQIMAPTNDLKIELTWGKEKGPYKQSVQAE